ncbi:hypothetical protein CEXT_356161 [Caerostris extrusa]|uniref:Uncharacterized protein n=1 Tax=Caerostris extrusa TaxID=172846 RepID=A0AAV4UIT7_CAEEX|nr:hypothetical protein CEXT_356161 [Caerostris extrusa]
MNLSADNRSNTIGRQTLVHSVMYILPVISSHEWQEHQRSIRSGVPQSWHIRCISAFFYVPTKIRVRYTIRNAHRTSAPLLFENSTLEGGSVLKTGPLWSFWFGSHKPGDIKVQNLLSKHIY